VLPLILLLFVISSPVFSNDRLSLLEKKKEYHFKLNTKKNTVTELTVKIPDRFTVSYDLSHDNLFAKEFIPTGEKFESWSEIITFHECIAYNPSLTQIVEDTKAHFRNINCKIDNESTTQEETIPVATFVIEAPAVLINPDNSSKKKQEPIDGQNELIAMKVIQGPFSTATIQYTMRYKVTKTSPQEKQAIKEKLLAFLHSCSIEKRQL